MVKIIKTLRTTAWILVFVVALTLLSGFLAVKPSVFPWFSKIDGYYLHVIVLPLLFVPLVYIHSLMGILLFFARNKKYDKPILKILAGGLWSALFVLFGYLYFAQNPTPQNNVQTANITANTATNATGVVLNFSEIARHNTISDCWMIIGGKVYNVSDYATAHPGGEQAITSFCGKDGTSAFATKGGKGAPHSGAAQDLLSSFYLGDFGGSVTPSAVTSTQKKLQNVPKNDDEWDD
jgi:cytochrome b involved in lipid metabolism